MSQTHIGDERISLAEQHLEEDPGLQSQQSSLATTVSGYEIGFRTANLRHEDRLPFEEKYRRRLSRTIEFRLLVAFWVNFLNFFYILERISNKHSFANSSTTIYTFDFHKKDISVSEVALNPCQNLIEHSANDLILQYAHIRNLGLHDYHVFQRHSRHSLTEYIPKWLVIMHTFFSREI